MQRQQFPPGCRRGFLAQHLQRPRLLPDAARGIAPCLPGRAKRVEQHPRRLLLVVQLNTRTHDQEHARETLVVFPFQKLVVEHRAPKWRGRTSSSTRCRRGGRIVDAGQLDHDLVRPLLADLGLRDAELVDPIAHGFDRRDRPRSAHGPWGGTAWRTTSSPPCRSRPRVAFLCRAIPGPRAGARRRGRRR